MLFIFLHMFFYDIWFYISHVLLHQPKWYIMIHKIHHKKSYDELVYSDTNEGHIVEHVVQPLGFFVPCFISGWSYKEFILAYLIIAARALMCHDYRCSWLIGNHHLLHHKYRNYNYGEYWIDCICGTVYPNKDEYIYGLIYT
jgi:sterol desaturase/sphingolipid hydroxylase (fatty acid hydroxylase superfamily)